MTGNEQDAEDVVQETFLRAYQRGMDALDHRQWRQAVAAFDEVIGQAADRVDGALYWKAYTLSKNGRIDAAAQALNRLLRDHPDSRWIKDGKALQLELRQHGAPESDSELRQEAVRHLSHMDSEAATEFMLEILGE
jgi:DNA-directed RNA polymerase specialized sigma24 family protein